VSERSEPAPPPKVGNPAEERRLAALALALPLVVVVWRLVVSGPVLAPAWFTLVFLVAQAPLTGYGIWTSSEIGDRAKTLTCAGLFVLAGVLALILLVVVPGIR
jgi:hypothetical protein